MEQIELKANVRKTTGNGPARVLRREGRIPAVLYGPETEHVLLSVNTGDFEEVLKKGNVSQVLLNLVIQNGKAFSKSAHNQGIADASGFERLSAYRFL